MNPIAIRIRIFHKEYFFISVQFQMSAIEFELRVRWRKARRKYSMSLYIPIEWIGFLFISFHIAIAIERNVYV